MSSWMGATRIVYVTGIDREFADNAPLHDCEFPSSARIHDAPPEGEVYFTFTVIAATVIKP